uniref:Sodium/potassium exporting P-type ATPase 1 n=1 Tax=Palpitomonas bilix TaxID=652834 RepID=A0A7S3GD75_9EUKA
MEQFGSNELKGGKKVNPVLLFLQHLFSYLLLLLMVAMVFSIISQEYIEAGVIGFIVLFNATVGFLQEYKSEQTLAALKSLSASFSTVRRGGEILEINSRDIVPGDIIILEEGDIVPADLRLIETSSLEINEATLTGEAAPVHKVIEERINAEEALGDRANMAYSGCVVTRGRGEGVVVATGQRTELGKIAQKVSKKGSKATRMQIELRKLAISLFIVGMLLGVLVLGVHSFVVDKEVSMYAISLGVAAIPESLMAVLTLAMAMGVKRMAKCGAVVRKLTALESLSSTTDICSDKTGTLTQAKMVVANGFACGLGAFAVQGTGWHPVGEVKFSVRNGCTEENGTINKGKFERELLSSELLRSVESSTGMNSSAIHQLVLCSTLCNSATVTSASSAEGTKAVGDPTEIALECFAQKLGFTRNSVKGTVLMTVEFPFDSVVKKMTRVYKNEYSGKHVAYLKGALEAVLEASSFYLNCNNEVTEITEEYRQILFSEMNKMAGRGLRVMAFAYRNMDDFNEDITRDDVDNHMILIGLLGIYDPPRDEAKESVEQSRSAGINVRMVTGDHPATAAAIAQDISILSSGEDPHAGTMVGHELDRMSKSQLDDLLVLPRVVSRCSPDTKVNLIHALHRRGKVVVMTGDGVNDAPALKSADIGVAMGQGGSDVTKEAADIVLSDDNISTIVKAIKEGRRISDNIQKFIVHLLTGNVAQVIALIVGLSMRDRYNEAVFPMSPLQILWLNMITISPPALSLAVEKAEADIMERPPRKKGESLFTKDIILDIFVYGVLGGALTLASFVIAIGFVNPVQLQNESYTPANLSAPYWENNSVQDLAFHDYLGIYCNQRCTLPTEEACEEMYACSLVQRARATAFATLTFILLLNGFNCRAAAKTVFEAGILKNKFMTASLFFGIALMIPTMYIPIVNKQYFKQRSITIEWAIVVASAAFFFTVCQVIQIVKYKLFIKLCPLIFFNPCCRFTKRQSKFSFAVVGRQRLNSCGSAVTLG